MRLCSLILFLFLSINSIAQSLVSGSVLDLITRESIVSANIRLLTQDSAFVEGVATDNKGQFIIRNINKDNYILAISYIGYKDIFINIPNLKSDLEMNPIFMESNSILLHDVSVKASRVIGQIDKKILFPSLEEKKISGNGLILLRNMQLPNLQINTLNKTIETLQGGTAAVYLNGVPVPIEEVIALQPNEIIKIEYHDEPSLRYGNAAAVVDFITRRRVSGGNVSMDLNNALSSVGVSNNSFSTKYNYKKSSFGVNGSWDYRKVNWTRENEDVFTFSDKIISRHEVGEPTKYLDHGLDLDLIYNLREADRYTLNIRLKNHYKNIPNDFTDRVGTIYSSDSELPISVSDKSTDYGNTPSLDIYYQQVLKKKQVLILNVVGTHIATKTSRYYQEQIDGQTLTEKNSQIKGSKNSLIAEGIYEKSYEKSKLSGGLKYIQSYTENTYMGTVVSQVNMKFSETYAYLEYQLNRKRFNFIVGAGATRTYNKQGDKSTTSYLFRPTLRAFYKVNSHLQLKYSANITNNTPGLAAMNMVEQAIDSFQIRRGNPDLLSYTSYNNNLTAFFNYKILSVNLFAGYTYVDKPIMESIFLENDKFIRMQENQKSNQQFYANLNINIRPIKYISFRIASGIDRYINKGNIYVHTYTNLYMKASMLVNYENWSLYADCKTRRNRLVGETVERGELLHTINIGYNANRWGLGLGMINPFTKDYLQDTRNLSNLVSSYSKCFSHDMGRIVTLNFSWNFDWGVKYKTEDRRISNSDTDSGIISGKRE
ncbi:MAG: carboxypeptidase-like regulatory domain-containing protein [Bacteroides sp.]